VSHFFSICKLPHFPANKQIRQGKQEIRWDSRNNKDHKKMQTKGQRKLHFVQNTKYWKDILLTFENEKVFFYF